MRRAALTSTMIVAVLTAGIMLSGCGRLASLGGGGGGSQPPAAPSASTEGAAQPLDGSLAALGADLAEADSASDEAAADLAAADRAAATPDEP